MNRTRARNVALLLGVLLVGCASVRSVVPSIARPRSQPSQAETTMPQPVARQREEPPRPRVAPTPYGVQPSTRASAPIQRAALADKRLRILVSTSERTLWLLRGTTVMIAAPVAVGMHQPFTWAGTTYDFKTPHGRRTVSAKSPDPIWVPPDWHYFEKAAQDNLDPVQLVWGQIYSLSDGTRIEVRGNEVGRVNSFGNFWPFTAGKEIIFDGKIFIPPIGSDQRKVPEVLGTHKLEIGNGYLIHGTNESTSIGEAVSHGCVRMYNEDVVRIYEVVPTGTPVYIF